MDRMSCLSRDNKHSALIREVKLLLFVVKFKILPRVTLIAKGDKQKQYDGLFCANEKSCMKNSS